MWLTDGNPVDLQRVGITFMDVNDMNAGPVVRLVNDTVIGYEALARFPPRARIHTPDQLFGAAAALNMQSSVDR